MKTHFHYGHGITGHGPDEPQICRTLRCLADCVRTSLDDTVQCWLDQSHGERFHIEQLRKARPSNGSDPIGYEGSWESIATAALRALECLDNADDADTLRQNLNPTRSRAPLYNGNPEAWEVELRRLLLGSDTYPMTTAIDGSTRFYVWQCADWRCLLNEHDQDYTMPLACRADGGYVPCACRDCTEITIWSPGSGEAPYCPTCADADCADRDQPGCLTDSDDV